MKIEMLTTLYFALPILFTLLFSEPAFAQPGAELIAVDKKLSTICKKSGFPGFAVGIVRNDSVVFAKGYGYADLKTRKPFTEKTILPVGSVSKTSIAFAIAKAIELRYFDSETPINDILPYLVKNPFFPEDTIRIKHLYTHTSGIIDNETVYQQTYQLRKIPDIPLADFLKSYLEQGESRYAESNFDPVRSGTAYRYSNIGSALAAHLIEIRAHISFAEFTRRYLFEPLGMVNTHWFYDDEKSEDYATLYEVNIPDVPLYEQLVNPDKSLKIYSCVTYPDGSLKSNVEDLSIFLNEMMKGQTGQSGILKQEPYALLFKKQFADKQFLENFPPNNSNQAIFWSYNRKGRLVHTGNDAGIFAVVSVDFATNTGRIVVINTNLETVRNEKLVKGIVEIAAILERIEKN